MKEFNIKYLIKKIGKCCVKINCDLTSYNSFKIKKIAKFLFLPNTIKKSVFLIKYLKKFNKEFVILGNGTNVLIQNNLNIVICFKNLKGLKINKTKVFAESGVSLFYLNEKLASLGFSSLEKSYGIPASVGGAVVQNCGAYGFNISDKITKVLIFNGKTIKFIKKENLNFAYRTSIFKENKNLVVLGAEFVLEKKNKDEILNELNTILTLRKEKQPYEYPSAGSVFKRYEGVIISKLIDELGLKGYEIGGAKISEKHAGFIVNFNNATSEDVLNLINFVKNKIKSVKNIDLNLEIVLL